MSVVVGPPPQPGGPLGFDEALQLTDVAGRLTEFVLMGLHTEIGEGIVASIGPLAHLATAIRAAHERWDGGGYPDGLRGEQIPLASRIVFACGAYDAMTADCTYRTARASADALREL
jgi:two-component system, cell cycle response regulator